MPAKTNVPTLLIALCLPLLAASPRMLNRDALRGTWTATITPDPGSPGKDHTDTLTFTKGFQFKSDELAKQGFEPAPYNDRSTPIGAAATFDVTLKNKAGDTAAWQATAAAGQMTGTLVLTPKDGAPASYTFAAQRK